MIFGKSITLDPEDLENTAAAARLPVFGPAEQIFVQRLKAGNAEAFDILVTRYASHVYAFLVRINGNTEDAADLTQETFLSALKAIRGFRGEAELKTWLFRIAINHSRNRHRWWQRRRRDETTSLDAETGDGSRTFGETIADRSASPEENLLRGERQEQINLALAALPDAYRETIVLRDVEGLSYDEIAAALEIGIGTVKSRLARGREELRRKLSDF